MWQECTDRIDVLCIRSHPRSGDRASPDGLARLQVCRRHGIVATVGRARCLRRSTCSGLWAGVVVGAWVSSSEREPVRAAVHLRGPDQLMVTSERQFATCSGQSPVGLSVHRPCNSREQTGTVVPSLLSWACVQSAVARGVVEEYQRRQMMVRMPLLTHCCLDSPTATWYDSVGW